MNLEQAYKPPKPFWAMSIPELVVYNNKCKRLDEYFFKGKPLKTLRAGGKNIKKRRKTRNRKNRKTRRRKNKRTRRRRKLATIRTTHKHHSDQTETKT